MTGLYVHVPLCARACPYCDFDFEVGPAHPQTFVAPYLEGLRRELRVRGDDWPAPRTVYLGGGTPSRLGPDGLRALGDLLAREVDLSCVEEYTVELNPEDVSPALLSTLGELAVGRVSLGVQSVHGDRLRQLGRGHDGRAALEAIAAARQAGLTVSADLIVGAPGQPAQESARDLEAILGAGAAHVSVYALTIEDGTPWARQAAAGRRRLPQADAQADALLALEDAARERGLTHYEVASYARREGDRAQHNLGYWTGVDYLGVGPSAASARHHPDGTVARRTNARGLAAWRAGAAPSVDERLDPESAAREALWLALRVLTGVCVPPLLARIGRDEVWLLSRTERSVRQGNLVREGDSLRVGPGRWVHHDAIASSVL